jgi:hypothetical protein
MAAPDVFGVIVRTVGLLLTIYALWHLVYGLGILGFKEEEHRIERGNYLRFGVVAGSMGLFLMFGAVWITSWAY